jgi:hypothetical protein
MFMDLVQAITLIVAVTGAVLGIVNTIDRLNRNRVRLKVVPAHAIPIGGWEDKGPMFCIDVINFSSFPVTISAIGFAYSRMKAPILDPLMPDGESLPKRLEPHENVVVYYSISRLHPEIIGKAKKAYAQTSSGIIRTGKSGALKQLIRESIKRESQS